MRRIKSLVVAFVLGFILSLGATVAIAQVDSARADSAQAKLAPLRPRFVVVDDYVRDFLTAEWDAHANDPIKLERGYCLRFQLDFWASEVAYRVTQITRAVNEDADTHSIDFSCVKNLGETIAEVHIHPPQTCSDETHCWTGGSYGYQCLPSDDDRKYLTHSHQPFGMVQCDRHAIVFYFPYGDNR